MLEFNFNNQDFYQNPYKYYKEFRNSNDVVWLSLSERNGISSNGIKLFSKYADALEIFNNDINFSKDISKVRSIENISLFDSHILHRDGVDHLRLRKITESFFRGKNLNYLLTIIEKNTLEQISSFSITNEIDLIDNYSEIIPLISITTLLGIPKNDIYKIRAWTKDLTTLFDFAQPKIIVDNIKPSFDEYINYVKDFILNYKPNSNTLVGTMLLAEKAGQMTINEVISMTALFLLTGHATTIDLIGNGLWLFLSNKNELSKLNKNHNLINNAIEEILRYECPGQRAGFRIVTKPIKIGKTHLEIGDQIDIIIGSVNHDESVFENPEVFNIERKNNKHLSFGIGTHNCLGQTLARMNARIAFKSILPILNKLELINKDPMWRKNTVNRGLEHLFVSFK